MVARDPDDRLGGLPFEPAAEGSSRGVRRPEAPDDVPGDDQEIAWGDVVGEAPVEVARDDDLQDLTSSSACSNTESMFFFAVGRDQSVVTVSM